MSSPSTTAIASEKNDGNKIQSSKAMKEEKEGASRAAAKGVILSIVLRFLSFFGTQLTVRFVDPSTFGKVSIRLHLLLNTALFLGREGFRLGLLRSGGTGTADGKVVSDGDACNVNAVSESSDDTNTIKQQNFEKDKVISKERKSQNKEYEKEEEEKKDDEMEKRRIRVNNVAWLSVPTGLCLAFLALLAHLKSCSTSDSKSLDNDHDYRLAGLLYCLAASIESLSEPLVISCMRSMDVTSQATADGIATLGRTFTCVALLVSSNYLSSISSSSGDIMYLSWMRMVVPGPLSAFGIAQCVHAVLLTGVLYWKKWDTIIWPRRMVDVSSLSSIDNPYRNESSTTTSTKGFVSSLFKIIKTNFDLQSIKLSIIFTLQSIFKHMLTEGDRIVLTALQSKSHYNQGVYAMASSYGGMASRLLFQPLEENGRLLFSAQASLVLESAENIDRDDTIGTKVNGNTDTNNNINYQNAKMKTLQHAVQQLKTTYCTLIKLVVYIGLIFAALAPNYTSTLLQILAGPRWGSNPEASSVLSSFCMYLSTMALNGMTEAFVYGVAGDGGDVGRLAVAHGVVGIVFYVMAPVLVFAWGTIGLVFANGFGMILRSLYSFYFASVYFGNWTTLVGDGTVGSTIPSNEKDKRLQHGKGMKKFNSKKQVWNMWLLVKQSMPHPAILLAFVASYVTTWYSFRQLYRSGKHMSVMSVETGMHVGTGVLCALVVAGLVYKLERDFGHALKSMVSKQKKD